MDKAIRTMRDTGRDMLDKHKETSRGGLADLGAVFSSPFSASWTSRALSSPTLWTAFLTPAS
jgi:hypothetical protein